LTSQCDLPMSILRALRPKQWLKNGLVLAALVFAGRAFDWSCVSQAVSAMFLFCAVSSGLYLVNDVADIEKDRVHPIKKLRPIAAGAVSVSLALPLAAVLIVGGLGLGFVLSVPFGVVLTVYATISLAYSLGLKNIVLVDVFVLAGGFVLRAVAGAVVIEVEVSDWLLICTLLLALFMALCKRRHEMTLLGEEAPNHRPVFGQYTPYLLDQMIGIVTGAIFVCYSLYTMWPETVEKFQTTDLKYSIPFVLLGIFRYLYLVHRKAEGGAPERVLLTDVPLIVTILAWAASVFIVVYRQKMNFLP